MDIKKFVRRSFDVRGVQVTSSNIEEVAKWVSGTIHRRGEEGHEDRYIKVDVKHPLNERQTQAHVGDWVLKTKKGVKVYTDRAFHANFMGYEDLSTAVRQNVYVPPGLVTSEQIEQARNAINQKRG